MLRQGKWMTTNLIYTHVEVSKLSDTERLLTNYTDDKNLKDAIYKNVPTETVNEIFKLHRDIR